MSPRRSDPSIRAGLLDVAARLLSEHGPRALSARRVAAEASSSTMALYTHFGGMSGLVRAMVREGFVRLEQHLNAVGATDDPVADMALLGRAYRRNALANSHLYSVMFGGSSLAGFSLSEEDRQAGRYTLLHAVECAVRCGTAGRFSTVQPEMTASQMWIAVHGLVTLELGGYLIDPLDADRCFEAQLVSLMIGAGDEPEAATRSVAASGQRLADVRSAD